MTRPLGLVLLAVAALAPPAPGQQGGALPPLEAVEEKAEVGNNPRGAMMFAWADENFDQWVFNNQQNSAGSARAWIDSLLAMKIEEVDRACGLSPAQKAKLRLAGLGDVKRFFDVYDAKKKKFQAMKNDQNKINQIFQEIQPLQASVQAGLFGEGSFFAKAVPRALEPSQAERFEAVARDRRAYRYRARVELAVNLLENSVGFTGDQRQKLVDVLVRETRPPRRFGQQDYQVVLYQASQVPEEKLRPIFDDAQWRRVRQRLNQAKGMGLFLKNNGFLPEDAKADPGADAKPTGAAILFPPTDARPE